jgi:type I restriction enzyme S subunit
LDSNNYVFSTGYAQIRPTVNPYFLFSKLQENKFVEKVLNKSTGTSYPAINSNDLSKIEILITANTIEQKQIGNVFELIDKLITLQQQQLDLYTKLKKGLLQKLFPKDGEKVPEIRFADFHDDWEQHKLGDLVTIVGGGTPDTSRDEYWNGDIDWYSPFELNDQIFLNTSKKKITKLGLKKSSAKILPKGTILFTSRAGIGNTAILTHEGTTNQGFQSLVPNKSKINTYFLYSCSNQLKRYGEKVGSGSTFKEISGKQLSKMNIWVPKLNEQFDISSLINKIDMNINLQQRKLNKLKLFKKFLLQKLFI